MSESEASRSPRQPLTPLVVRTTNLGRHRGITVVFGHNQLLTLAPGQKTAPGTLVVGGDPQELAKVTAATFRTEPVDALEVILGTRRPNEIDLTLRAKGQGAVVLYIGKQPVASVTIGFHRPHLDARAVDLIASVSNGPDCRKIVAIQEILQERPPIIIDQIGGPFGTDKDLVCGSVVQQAGEALFGRVDHSGLSYHKPISTRPGVLSWSDIVYDPMTTQTAVAKIKAHLDRGIAVRLGAVYSPKFGMLGPNGALQAERNGGHTILAVGYWEEKLLYLDPYPSGSRTEYRGGLPFNRRKVCSYLGVLEISHERGAHLQAKVEEAQAPKFGAFEVISGPLH